jgi:HD-GYP domain-containing protein (c-di-GMP phosphodiesterase class II)
VSTEGTAEAAAAGAQPQGGEVIVTLGVGLPEGARRRLTEFGGFELRTEVEDAGDAELVLVSTRLPRGDLTGLLAAIRERCHGRLVALVHTGGEGLAVEIMRAGGVAVVAEGNEQALQSCLTGAPHDTALVDTFERQVAQAGGGGDPTRDRDPVTGLPGAAAFEQRLEELAAGGDVPRVAFLRLLNLRAPDRAQGSERAAGALVRRRLSAQFMPLVRAYSAELYALDEGEFALVAAEMAPQAAEQLGARLTSVAAAFAPSGHTALALAMGHAGSEVSQELVTLQELAQRALEVAAVEKGGAVVNADTLSLGVSSTTELEAATRMVAFVEQHDPYPQGHGGRVAELASALARQLGYEGAANTRIRLAALLHDIGKVGLPLDAVSAERSTSGEAGEAYRTHPARGADYLRVSGGADVAAAVRSHHEHWDGSGFPDGLARDAIPIAARVIAVADAFDRLLHAAGGDEVARAEAALAALRSMAGQHLDPTLVEIAEGVIAEAYGVTFEAARAAPA